MSDTNESTPPAAPPLRRLSGEDALFLYAETPTMPMHTVGTVMLDPSEVAGEFGYQQIVERMRARIHLMPPFRKRVLEIPLGLGHPFMADDPDFDLANHLHHIAVAAPGDMRALAEIVADVAGALLPRYQPLWEMWVVEGVEGGRIALVTKLHHCMMDGASGANQMAHLMDLDREPEPMEAPPPWNPPALPSQAELARRSLTSRLVGPLRLGRMLFDTVKSVRSRQHAEAEVAERSAPRPGLSETGPETPFSKAISPHRSVAFASAPLDDVKRVKNAFGVTVNDAVLAAAALAVRRYLKARDALTDEALLCSVPVSLKTQDEKGEFSNKVATMTVRLPTHVDDPVQMVSAIHQETEDAKYVFEAGDGGLVPRWLEFAPPLATGLMARLVSDYDLANQMAPMMNLAVSNMRGAPMPLYFGGARVEAIYPMGPVGEGMGLNITVLSSMGRLDVGVLSCRELVPDPWEIADGFSAAVAELQQLAQDPAAAQNRASTG